MAGNQTSTELYFCSSNTGKYEHLLLNTQHIKSVKILQKKDIDVIEPQLNSIEEIALYKARCAYEKLKIPVIVQDSGLVIKSLNDFPGPYTKYASQTIGCAGIIKLMEGTNDRSCGWDGCLVFIDEHGVSHTFKETNTSRYWGKIANPSDVHHILGSYLGKEDLQLPTMQRLGKIASSWSSSSPNQNFWTIFVPSDIPDLPNNKLPLAQLNEEQLISYRKSRKSCFKNFAKWLEEKTIASDIVLTNEN